MVFLTFVEITCKLLGNFNKLSECFLYRCEFQLLHPLIPPSLILSQNLSFSMFSLMHLVIYILPALSAVAFSVHCVIIQPVKCNVYYLFHGYSSIPETDLKKNQPFEQQFNDSYSFYLLTNYTYPQFFSSLTINNQDF